MLHLKELLGLTFPFCYITKHTMLTLLETPTWHSQYHQQTSNKYETCIKNLCGGLFTGRCAHHKAAKCALRSVLAVKEYSCVPPSDCKIAHDQVLACLIAFSCFVGYRLWLRTSPAWSASWDATTITAAQQQPLETKQARTDGGQKAIHCDCSYTIN